MTELRTGNELLCFDLLKARMFCFITPSLFFQYERPQEIFEITFQCLDLELPLGYIIRFGNKTINKPGKEVLVERKYRI